MEYIRPQTMCLFSTSVLRAICEIDFAWLRTQKVIHIDFLQKPYGKPRRSQVELENLDYLRWSPSHSSAISLAPSCGFFSGGSVAATAIQIAFCLNPRRIGLAGIDLSNASEPRFYEVTGHSAKSRIVQTQSRILEIFALAQAECRNRGIDLVNYSPISALSALGVPYDDRLSGLHKKEV